MFILQLPCINLHLCSDKQIMILLTMIKDFVLANKTIASCDYLLGKFFHFKQHIFGLYFGYRIFDTNNQSQYFLLTSHDQFTVAF